MHLIRNRPSYKAQSLAIAVACAVFTPSCTYRFSNSFQRGKSNIHTLCVEGIYSVARDVVPYQIIWESIQRRIAMDGTFFVDDCAEADAIVVGELVDASVAPAGEAYKLDDLKQDKVITDPVNAAQADYRRLEVGSEVKRSQSVTYNLKVDVHDLRTQALLFSKIYSRSESYRVFLDSNKITKNHELPIAEESLATHTKSIGTDFASRIVTDLRSNLLR